MDNERHDCSSSEQINDSKAETIVKEALLLKQEELARQLKDIDAIIHRVQVECSLRIEQLQAQKKPLEDALHHLKAFLHFESPESADSAKVSITDAAFYLLEDLHQPMHYKAITARLNEINVYIHGKNPAATLLTRMTRDNRFRRSRKRGTYALTTWRVRNRKGTEILADDRAVNMKRFIKKGPNGKQIFLFRRPWSQGSLFAMGVYGRG